MGFDFPPAKASPEVVIQDGTTFAAFDTVIGGVIGRINDTAFLSTKRNGLKYYVKRIDGGSSVDVSDIYTVPAETLNGGGRGIVKYKSSDPTKTNKIYKIFAFQSRIFIEIGGRISLFRDVKTSDGVEIDFLYGPQMSIYMYLSIGGGNDPYKFDGTDNIHAISSVSAGGVGEIVLTTGTSHLLEDSEFFTVSGTTNYNDDYTVISKTATTITVSGTFTGTETGTVTGAPKLGAPAAITGMPDASLLGEMENRLLNIGNGVNSVYAKYSDFQVTGSITTFVFGTGILSPGNLSGIKTAVMATTFLAPSIAIVAEEGRITGHAVGDAISLNDGVGTLVKPEKTQIPDIKLEGKGVKMQRQLIEGRSGFFFADPSAGIFYYNPELKQSLSELTKGWKDELFERFDLSQSSVAYHPERDWLLVTVAIEKGVSPSQILIYNFESGKWSLDPTKEVNQMVWDSETKTMWGLHSTDPRYFELYDGTYNVDGEDIELDIVARPYSSRRESLEKEYNESNVEVGFTNDLKGFTYAVIPDKGSVADSTVFVPTKGKGVAALSSPSGPQGVYMVGVGLKTNTKPVTFKQYRHEEAVDDSRNYQIRITTKANLPFFVFQPEIDLTIREDTAQEL